MDKKELRRQIRDRKRAMTETEIVEKSEKLGALFAASPLYQNAKTIYGYLPYNQEVRTIPMLEQALKDGKRVAVPKVIGDEMIFIFMDDLSKVEKGCLIFARDEQQGYQVAIVDNTKKQGDSKYWRDSFLHIKSYNSPRHQTTSLVDVCNEFINTTVAQTDRLSKVDKAMLSIRAKQVLQENETLSVKDFTEEVFQDYILESKFNDYVAEKGLDDQIHQDGIIKVDRTAIKKSKTKVETIKLDSNFDLRIYGGQDRIIKGYDEDAGLRYYQLFFEEEK